SYRVSRHGVLLEAERARIYHHNTASGRVSRGMAAELSAMNMAYLLRKNGAAGPSALPRLYVYLGRRVCAEFLKDLFSRRFRFPQLRALARASASAWQLWTISSGDLSARYALWQRGIVQRHGVTIVAAV